MALPNPGIVAALPRVRHPSTSGGGLLYYRKDLLDKYGLKPPTTFDEMKAACDTIQAGEKDSKLGCFAGQYRNYEGLTVTLDEAVRGATPRDR